MKNLIILNLLTGDFDQGFPGITAQIWTDGPDPMAQATGQLSPEPEMPQLYLEWQEYYEYVVWPREKAKEVMRLGGTPRTNVSKAELRRLGAKLSDRLNTWLDSNSFRPIENKLREHFNPAQEIRLIIQTEDIQLRRLPWHSWKFFDSYPKAEVALSAPKFEQVPATPPRTKRRILAIIGDSKNIDTEADREFLAGLSDAETIFLPEPKRADIDTWLWDTQGWDIFCFSGHSSSEKDGSTGCIYINEKDRLSLDQLKNALKAAIGQGLQLAIFNSCDGLGLARQLGDLHLPQIIVMREIVPDAAAQEFLKNFLQAFSGGKSLYLAVREAREKLDGLEEYFPGVSRLPIICQNPSAMPMVWSLPREVEPVSVPSVKYHNLPRRLVRFVGRSQELENLHEQLQQPDGMAIVAIAGMGGIGKTELALQYAWKYLDDYPAGVCWLRSRAANLAGQIVEFAQIHLGMSVPQELGGKQLTLDSQVAWCWQNWQPPGQVLIVLDDVTDLSTCSQLLPPGNPFRVLATTRQRFLDTRCVEVSLEVLSLESSLELLAATMGEEGQERIEGDRLAAENLCNWLGYLPLGLELVGRYLAEDPDISLPEMLEQLQEQHIQDEALDIDEAHKNYPLMTAPRGIRAAFELSWQDLDEYVADVGQLLGLFALDVIPWKLVEATAQHLQWQYRSVNKAKKELRKPHLIQRLKEEVNREEVNRKEGVYKVHPLIREFLQIKLEESGKIDRFKQAFVTAMVAIAQTIPQSATRVKIQKVTPAIPHLIEVAKSMTSYLGDEEVCQYFNGLVRFYASQGLYALAEPWCQQCLTELEKRFGKENLAVADSKHYLGELYYDRGMFAEAETIFSEVLELRKRLLGENHLDVATSLDSLADAYHALGRYDEEEPLYRQALKIRQELLGENRADIAISLNNLASWYQVGKNYREAETYYRQALEIRQRELGDNLLVAISQNNLAELYRETGRYRDAEPLYWQSLELTKRLLGEEHPQIATCWNNLGLFCYFQERFKEAEDYLQKALKLRQKLLGENHPDVGGSLSNLASFYKLMKRDREAEVLYGKALPICEMQLGPEHPITVRVKENLEKLRGEYSNPI